MIHSHNNSSRHSGAWLWAWLALGALAFVCVPALRARDPFWGWLPFWLLVAPLIDLALLHRRRLMAASQAFLVRRLRRRRSTKQARRLRTRRVLRRVPRLAVSP
jgi:hypothetical protein